MPAFRELAILGVGLIGGSVAAAARERGVAARVTGFDLDPDVITLALELGVIDAGAGTIAEVVADADLVVLAMPVRAMSGALNAMAASARPAEQLLTDVGSVKQSVVEAARVAFGEVPANFVPAHPIAGSEIHGVGAARASLFDKHRLILTPVAETDATAITRVTGFWSALGADVITMPPAEHDRVLAGTSHLPHLLAYALVDSLSKQGRDLSVFDFAAGGFRDFTRIAASDPSMWRDIFDANDDAVLAVLDQFTDDLKRLRTLVAEGDTAGLHGLLRRAKAARDHFGRSLEAP